MTADQIRDALKRHPFEPFDVRLVDGRSFTIHHTDWLSVPPVKRPRYVIAYTPRSPDPDDDPRAHFLDLNLIVELTIPTTSPTAAPAAEGNGHGA
jgi:hypothetical protein